MNPMAMMKLKPLLEQFAAEHPRFPAFIKTAAYGVDEGGRIDIAVYNSAGQRMSADLNLTASDIELIRQLTEMLSQ